MTPQIATKIGWYICLAVILLMFIGPIACPTACLAGAMQ